MSGEGEGEGEGRGERGPQGQSHPRPHYEYSSCFVLMKAVIVGAECGGNNVSPTLHEYSYCRVNLYAEEGRV